MGRWQPGARERLIMAAADLFAEQGYDETTVTQIAERAGVTKSTLFRHFPEKREILVAGQATLSALLAEGIAEAPASATPLEAVGAGLARASEAMGQWNRELSPRIQAAVAANSELRERSLMKSVGLATAVNDALVARGLDSTASRVAAEIGVLAFERGFAAWVEADSLAGGEGSVAEGSAAEVGLAAEVGHAADVRLAAEVGLAEHVGAALEELRAAAAALR